MKWRRARDARTGRFRTIAWALAHPFISVIETVRRKS